VGDCERGSGEGRIEVEIISCRIEGLVSEVKVKEVHPLVVRVNVRIVLSVLVEEEEEGVAGRELKQSDISVTSFC